MALLKNQTTTPLPIDQVLFRMYMKHRMRTYQAFFHVNPDYAYWYGWAMMTKDFGEIKKLAKTMRATHKKTIKVTH